MSIFEKLDGQKWTVVGVLLGSSGSAYLYGGHIEWYDLAATTVLYPLAVSILDWMMHCFAKDAHE